MRQFRNTPYLVSEQGEVFRKGKCTALKADVASRGYRRVTLCVSGKTERFLVHRMVAEVFLPKKAGQDEVNHLDGVPGNDMVTNLEWTTRSGNQLHAIAMGKKAHLAASKKASENKFSDSEAYFREKLGANFIALTNESPRNFVRFNCASCSKEMKCRTDSSALKDDSPTCKKCKYKMKI